MKFINTQIMILDNVLEQHYDKPISREVYLSFILWFERRLAMSGDFDTVEINLHNERTKWGYKQKNGKRYWVLDTILKTLTEGLILDSTGYLANIHNKQSHARYYSYTEQYYKGLEDAAGYIEEDIDIKTYIKTKEQLKKYEMNNPQYKLLTSNRFHIDLELSFTWMAQAYKNDIITKKSFLVNTRRVFDLADKDIYVVYSKGGRVYSSFSNLKKELRQFCYIDNEPLTSIDLKSSQPLIFATYLKKKYNDDDVNTFYDIVVNEDIYEYFINNSVLKTRDTAKKEMFRFLFKETFKGLNFVQSTLKKNFPNLYDIIKEEKKVFKQKGLSLANHLQEIEAKIFIPVCDRYVNKGCLSVHDSLSFKKEFYSEIKNEIEINLKTEGIERYTIK